jgi:DNA primase
MDSSVDEIKAKLSVEEVIGEYLQLQRAGRNLRACCPFHNEKTPSFMVSPERQSWHCFGCGEGGDIFSFVMKMEGVDFVDALKILGDKAGVEVKKTMKKFGSEEKKENILGVLEASKKFYQHCLKIKGGKKAYDYLSERGISDEMIQKFELGFAPDSWDLLSEYLKKKGFSETEIFNSGMTVKKDNGAYYDRFRGRIMFPINSIAGKTLGFSSRIMPGADESSAKYINTPETSVYNKGRVLYGLDKAKTFVRQQNECIMVEGNMDVIASHQALVQNVVATSGTALTPDQIRIIKRYTDNIVFSFDMDAAGVKAAGRAIDLALEEGMTVSIVQVPEGKDPADCVKKDPKLWQEASQQKIKIMDFYFTSVLGKYDKNDVEGKKKIAEELLNVIAKISNKIEQSFYLQRLSSEIGMSEDVLSSVIEEAKTKNRGSYQVANRKKEKREVANEADREYMLQQRILGAIITTPELFNEEYVGLGEFFRDKNFLKIYTEIESIYQDKKNLDKNDLDQVKQKIEDEDVSHSEASESSKAYNAAAFCVEDHDEEDNFNVFKEAQKCVSSLRKISVENQLKEMAKKITEAKNNKDFELEAKLMQEQSKLAQRKNEF